MKIPWTFARKILENLFLINSNVILCHQCVPEILWWRDHNLSLECFNQMFELPFNKNAICMKSYKNIRHVHFCRINIFSIFPLQILKHIFFCRGAFSFLGENSFHRNISKIVFVWKQEDFFLRCLVVLIFFSRWDEKKHLCSPLKFDNIFANLQGSMFTSLKLYYFQLIKFQE